MRTWLLPRPPPALRAAAGCVILTEPNTNLISPRTALPALVARYETAPS
ncbi:hypothetical protein [Nonomuraea sp. NPDC049784]